ncbi:MAG: hypothetical protein ABI193_05640 [Minicystis sp.]
MSNGRNAWDVSFSRISWLETVLATHKNVTSAARGKDIVFDIQRRAGRPVSLLCLDEYVLGLAAVQRALLEFREVGIVFVGGTWNRYTIEAKQYCLDAQIGLYNAVELSGALWKDEYWAYHRVDQEGNPVYQTGTERK